MLLADPRTLLLGTNQGFLYHADLGSTSSACQLVWQAPGQAINCLASTQQQAGSQVQPVNEACSST